MDRARLIGYAQIGLSALFLGGYFAVLAAFLLGYIRTPVEWKDALMTILGVLTGAVGVILSFWFSRSRKESEA
jgi:ABC-type multidrug transport system permease subunit